MESKLTLKLNSQVLEQAKDFASKQNISLSKLVENYFRNLKPKKKKKEIEITPLVKELSGIIKTNKNFNYKAEVSDYLLKKYKI